MKNKLKKGLAISLAFMLMLSPLTSYALVKEETVYTKLNSDGSVKKTFVNEHLVNEEKTDTIEDLTDLNNIINLNGSNKFNISDNIITFRANGSDIFYQGETNKSLPISVDVTYKLDGKEIELDKLIGKSGHVEISINYTNNLKREVYVNGVLEELYQPFVVATFTNIPTLNNSNIDVTNGKVVDNGVSYMILGLSSPGLYESLGIKGFNSLDNITITLDTEKFELPSIYSVSTPKLLSSDDLEIFDKLNILYSSVDRLQSSIDQIASGSSLISENMGIVLEKIELIKEGAVSVDEGLNQILTELNNAKTELSASVDETKLAQMQKLIETNEATITKLSKTNEDAKNAYLTYHLDLVNYDNMASYVVNTLHVEEASVQATVASLTNAKFVYENMYEANNNMITLLSTNNAALTESIKSFNDSMTKINTLINTLTYYLSTLEEGTKQLSDGTSALKDGVAVLNGKMAELTNGINTFNAEGISQLSNYANSIKEVSGRVKALAELSSSYKTFALVNGDVSANTKFVYVIDAKSAPKEVKTKTETKKKENIIDKFFNLFK